jgi:uncharacterized MAPEG superfamily protein
MPELATTYSSVLTAWVVMALMYTVQAIVADLTAVRVKHTPGIAVASGHDDPLFRTARAQANTNENLPMFILITTAAMLLGHSVTMTVICTWVFIAGRAIHMVSYYADLRPLRSTGFVVGFVSMTVLAVSLAIDVFGLGR